MIHFQVISVDKIPAYFSRTTQLHLWEALETAWRIARGRAMQAYNANVLRPTVTLCNPTPTTYDPDVFLFTIIFTQQ